MIDMEVKEVKDGVCQYEKEVILAIAKRYGCDRDGDIINFFVKEDEGIVDVLPTRHGMFVQDKKKSNPFSEVIGFIVGTLFVLASIGISVGVVALIWKFVSWSIHLAF